MSPEKPSRLEEPFHQGEVGGYDGRPLLSEVSRLLLSSGDGYFKDPEVPLPPTSIGNGTGSGERLVWKRLREVCPLYPDLNVSSRLELLPDGAGSMLNAAALLMGTPGCIEGLFPAGKAWLGRGCHPVRLWLNGGAIDVVVDDRIPTIKPKENIGGGNMHGGMRGGLLWPRCLDRNNAWPLLLAKAVMKSLGKADPSSILPKHIKESIPFFLRRFTGGQAGIAKLSEALKPWQRYDQAGSIADIRGLLSSLHDSRYGGALIGVMRLGSAPGGKVSQGLATGAVYGVKGVVHYKGETLIEMTDSWDNSRWKGRWGNGTSEWSECAISSIGHDGSHDGHNTTRFFMSAKDWLLHFTHILWLYNPGPPALQHPLSLGASTHAYHGSFPDFRADAGSNEWCLNIQLPFHLTSASACSISLHIEPTYHGLGLGLENSSKLAVGWHLFEGDRRMSHFNKSRCVASSSDAPCDGGGAYRRRVEVGAMISLPKGNYVLVPSSLYQASGSCFTLRLLTSEPSKLGVPLEAPSRLELKSKSEAESVSLLEVLSEDREGVDADDLWGLRREHGSDAESSARFFFNLLDVNGMGAIHGADLERFLLDFGHDLQGGAGMPRGLCDANHLASKERLIEFVVRTEELRKRRSQKLAMSQGQSLTGILGQRGPKKGVGVLKSNQGEFKILSESRCGSIIEAGGGITSLLSRLDGTEFLWRDPLGHLPGYSEHMSVRHVEGYNTRPFGSLSNSLEWRHTMERGLLLSQVLIPQSGEDTSGLPSPAVLKLSRESVFVDEEILELRYHLSWLGGTALTCHVAWSGALRGNLQGGLGPSGGPRLKLPHEVTRLAVNATRGAWPHEIGPDAVLGWPTTECANGDVLDMASGHRPGLGRGIDIATSPLYEAWVSSCMPGKSIEVEWPGQVVPFCRLGINHGASHLKDNPTTEELDLGLEDYWIALSPSFNQKEVLESGLTLIPGDAECWHLRIGFKTHELGMGGRGKRQPLARGSYAEVPFELHTDPRPASGASLAEEAEEDEYLSSRLTRDVSTALSLPHELITVLSLDYIPGAPREIRKCLIRLHEAVLYSPSRDATSLAQGLIESVDLGLIHGLHRDKYHRHYELGRMGLDPASRDMLENPARAPWLRQMGVAFSESSQSFPPISLALNKQVEGSVSGFEGSVSGFEGAEWVTESLSELEIVFESLDTNNDGKISYKEWMRGLTKNQALLAKAFGGTNLSEVGAAFRRLDEDRDRCLTWEEFKAGIAQQQQPWPLRRNLSKFGQEASSSGSRAQELVDSSGSQGSASHGLPHVSQREVEEIDPDNLYQKYVRDKEQRADLIDTSFTEQSETVMRERQIRLQNLPSDDDL